jgi:tetratricopeptide (TPR) repeat protein
VAIHDSGTAGGCFYFVMNYIAGSSLDAYVREAEPGLETLLRLFATVCEGVNAAHLRGIVHRDLKPSNIRVDTEGQPHILDFGLAKVEEGEAAPGGSVAPAMTLTGQFVGSLPWASPEQASGASGGIDVRSDVYSLGVVLCQLLTGAFPYDVRGGMIEVVGRILHAEARMPRAATRGRIRINAEVETIVLKCLSKDPDRRYQNAGELARDLRHYLAGEPIDARRDSLAYVVRKQVRRHRIAFAFACTLVGVLVAGLAVSLTFWRRAESARTELQGALDRADRREKDMQQIADAQAKMIGSVDPQTMGARLRDDVLAEAKAALERSGIESAEVDARLAQLESLLAGTNFTNAGVRSIDRNVLAPALESVERDFAGQPRVQAALWRSIAKTYGKLGLYDAAVPPAKKALETCRRELGDDRPDTSESIKVVCESFGFGRQDALADAEPYLQEVLEIRRQALARSRREHGNEALETRDLGGDLAMDLWVLHKYAEAEPLYREGVEFARRTQGNEDPKTVESVAGMGTLLFYLGRASESEPYYREALEGCRRNYGDDDPTTLYRMYQLGYTLREEGKLEEAESYFRQSLEGYRRIPGDHEAEMTGPILHLGHVLQARGKLAEAEEYRREYFEINRRRYGDDHPWTLSGLCVLGSVLVEQGKYAEAESCSRRALEGMRRVSGDDSFLIPRCLNDLSRSLCGLGRLDEAEETGAEAVRRARAHRPQENGLIGASLMYHAKTLMKMQRFGEAEAALIEADTLIVAAVGPSRPRPKNPIKTLIELYDAWHAADPSGGHDIAAAQWKEKLQALEAPSPSSSSATDP